MIPRLLVMMLYMVIALVILTNAQTENAASDSLHYWSYRVKIQSDSTISAILETADALANAGLYKEATEILGTLPSGNKNVESDSSENKFDNNRHQDRRLRLSAGTDYFHLEDVDTSEMTPGEYKEYLDLTQTPLSIWLRAEYERSLRNGMRITPQWYFSGTRTRIEIPSRISILNERLDITASAKAEKWFQGDPSDPITFDFFKAFDSDMGGLSLKLTPMSEQTNPHMLWEIPCRLKWDHFREDRFGYESKIEYALSPLWQMRIGSKQQHTIRLNGDLRYRDYYRDISDSLDVLQVVTEAALLKRSDGGSYSIACVWYNDQYTNKNKLNKIASINRLELTARGEKQFGKTVLPRIFFRINQEVEERNPDSLHLNKYDCQGIEFLTHPSVRINVHEIFFIEPECIIEKRTSKTETMLWQPRLALEPGVRIGLTSQKYEATVFSGFRWEHTDKSYQFTIEDSRSIKAGLDGTASFFQWLSFNVMLDYQYRIYTPFNNRMTENLTVAANVSVNR
ncbi:MAG: hypothetical protein JW915_09195 [Chitinispirillaceae bacterium]|nr:hypothetical protein [Chitinispirillaceae bacterium]